MRIMFALVSVLMFIGVIFSSPIIHYSTMDTVENVEVIDKYQKRSGDTDRYMVVIKKANGEKEVLENTDSLLSWKFNSATVQAHLEQGSVCREMVVNGWRAGFFSWNRNIINAENC